MQTRTGPFWVTNPVRPPEEVVRGHGQGQRHAAVCCCRGWLPMPSHPPKQLVHPQPFSHPTQGGPCGVCHTFVVDAVVQVVVVPIVPPHCVHAPILHGTGWGHGLMQGPQFAIPPTARRAVLRGRVRRGGGQGTPPPPPPAACSGALGIQGKGNRGARSAWLTTFADAQQRRSIWVYSQLHLPSPTPEASSPPPLWSSAPLPYPTPTDAGLRVQCMGVHVRSGWSVWCMHTPGQSALTWVEGVCGL